MSASMRIISGSGVGFLPLHISARGTERKVGRNRRPKRERSGWCCYPMLCQSSWEELERSRSQNLSEPSSSSSTANMSRTHADARKNGGRVAGQSGKGGQLRNFAGWLKKKRERGHVLSLSPAWGWFHPLFWDKHCMGRAWPSFPWDRDWELCLAILWPENGMKYSSLQKLLSTLFPIVLVFPFHAIPRGLGQSITERSIIITIVERKTDPNLALPFKLV